MNPYGIAPYNHPCRNNVTRVDIKSWRTYKFTIIQKAPIELHLRGEKEEELFNYTSSYFH